MDGEASLTMPRADLSAGEQSVDAEVARRIAAGNTDEWDRFFDRYSPWAYNFAYRHLDCNHADAEDLCSDIMMSAARSIRKYDADRGSLDVWMHGLARHRLAHFCRKRRFDLPLIPEVLDSASGIGGATAQAMDQGAIERDVVRRALACLPERQATALVGKYVEGYTTDELARISDISPKAVESLLVRARGAFRSAFTKLLEGTSGGEQSGR